MPDNDRGTKVYCQQYENKDGSKRYWGSYGGYEVTAFRGRPHPKTGKPQLDVYVKKVEQEPRDNFKDPPPDDGDAPF